MAAESGTSAITTAVPVRCMKPYRVTKTIWLTPVFHSDAAEVFRVLNLDKSISEGLYSSRMTFPFPEECAKRFTERQLEYRTTSGVCRSWAIRSAPEGPMIGLFALDPFDHGNLGLCYEKEHKDADVGGDQSEGSEQPLVCGGMGYWISPEHTGRGIMGQVVTYALSQMARQEFGYDRVHGEAWVENIASRRVMERAGMHLTVGEPCYVAKFNATKDVAHYIYDVASASVQ
ncbi:hypothetical protein BG011_008840 [Mortierella polycephala]|uniref:N-acetyltransferase domain-containing protein n=1 Tax=Mortierella polycephala TaxID=41804 RepID=A0A9P6PQC4_9FUNG|nr:hypothetical protein BG011_008840 [Mortierella polycephala]